MGDSSKKVTVGYKYYLGEHMVLCHGLVDKITRIRVDQRDAWVGDVTNGPISINSPNLFGGEKREGGISGTVDFANGGPAQGRNSYLQGRLGAAIPAFRGVAALVLRQVYLGLNSYLKNWDVKVQRIHTRQNGVAQWLDAKSEVASGCAIVTQSNGWMVTRLTTNNVTISIDGTDWGSAEVGLGSAVASFFRKIDASGTVYSVGYNSSSYGVSTDGGATFTGRSIGLSVSAGGGRPIWDGTYYYVCGGVNPIRRSSDLISWTQPTSSSSSRANIIHAAGGFVYVASIYSTAINRSSDGGLTWSSTGLFVDPATNSSVTQGLLWRGNRDPQIDSSYTLLCVQAGFAGQYIRRIYKINSSVTTQTLVLQIPDHVELSQPQWSADGLAFDGISGWVAALTTDIWFSRDDGATWTKSANTFSDIWAVYSDGESFLLTHSSGVARSIDGGETWTSYTPAAGAIQYNGIYPKLGEPLIDNGDMNPAHIIRECLTDPDWGLGYKDSDIDDASFTSAANTLFDEQMGISILWDKQSTIYDFIDDIIRHIDATLFIDRISGKFVLKLLRDDYVAANLLVLDESNIDQVTDYSRPSFGELVNTVTVNYWDCSTSNTSTITVHDQALIQMQGGVVATTIEYGGFTNRTIASKVALRDLRSLSKPSLTCTLYTNRAASVLNIGDVFKFEWPDLHSGQIIMRVTEIAFGDGRSNKIRLKCVEDSFSTPITGEVADDGVSWEDPSVIPLASQAVLAVEAPYYSIVQEIGQDEIDDILLYSPEAGFLTAAAANPGTAINATLSVDAGAGYEDTSLVDFCPFGLLQDAIGYLDTEIFLTDAVDLDGLAVGEFAQLGNELVRIDEIDGNRLIIGRGIFDTVPTKHEPGAKFFGWQYFKGFDPTEYTSGETLSVKVLPSSGAGQVEASEVTAKQVTMSARASAPYPPGAFRIDGLLYPNYFNPSAVNNFSWAHRHRTQQTGAAFVDTLAASIGPEPGTTYTVSVYSEPGSVLITTQANIAGESVSLDCSAVDSEFVTIELLVTRNGFNGYQRHSVYVEVSPYIRPICDAAGATWVGAAAYTRPLCNSANASWS